MGAGMGMVNIIGPGSGTAATVGWTPDCRGNGEGSGRGIPKMRGGEACGAGSMFASGTGVGHGRACGDGVDKYNERER